MTSRVVSGMLLVLAGLVGGALSNLLFHGGPAVAAGPEAAPTVLEAREFRVVDAEGKLRARLGVNDDGLPVLELRDGAGQTQAKLAVLPDGRPWLVLSDAANKPRAMLSVLSDGGPFLGLFDAAGKGRVMLSVPPDGRPGLAVSDAAGNVLWQAP